MAVSKNQVLDKSRWNTVAFGESVYTVERAPELLAKIDLSLFKADPAFEKQPHKNQCINCKMYFEKSSVKSKVPNHRIIDLQRSWGVVIEGTRYTTASYLYANSVVCVFCEQLFSSDVPSIAPRLGKTKHRKDALNAPKGLSQSASHAQKVSVGIGSVTPSGSQTLRVQSITDSDIEGFEEDASINSFNTMETESSFGAAIARKYNNNPDNSIDIINNTKNGLKLNITPTINRRNVAVDKRVYQSSEVDGMTAECAISVPYHRHSRTRREVDPWWELDLGKIHHLHSISFQAAAQKGQNTEAVVMLFRKPYGFEQPFLEKAQRDAIIFQEFTIPACSEKHMELLHWELPSDVELVAIRVQLRGVHALHISEFKAFLGDRFVEVDEQESLRITKESYATLSPKRIKDNMVLMLSPIKKREITTARAKKMVKPSLFKSKFDICTSSQKLDSDVATAYAKQELWMQQVTSFSSVFNMSELHCLYEVIFKPTVIEGCKADPPAINNLPFGRKYVDESSLGIDMSELMDTCLTLHHPRCELMPLFTRIRAMLLMIQSFGNHPKPSWVGDLQWNATVCRLADDPSDHLHNLKSQFQRLEDHWEECQRTYLDKRGNPRKGRPDPQTLRGCSWSQFLVIFFLFIEHDKSKIELIPSMAYNVELHAPASRPTTRDTSRATTADIFRPSLSRSQSRPESVPSAIDAITKEARLSFGDPEKLEDLLRKSKSSKAHGACPPIAVVEGMAVVPYNGALAVVDGVSKTEYGSIGFPGGVFPNANPRSAPLLVKARDPMIPPMDTRFSEYKLENFKKRVKAEFVFPKELTLDFTRILLEDQKARAAGKVPIVTSPSAGEDGDNSTVMSFMSNTSTSNLHNARGPTSAQKTELHSAIAASPAEEYGAPKICTLCGKRFSYASMFNKVLFKHIISIRRHWDPALVSKDIQMLEQGTSMFNLVPVCMFCTQLFHPDFSGGIFFPIQEKYIEPVKSVVPDADRGPVRSTGNRFFDQRYPIKTPSGDVFKTEASSEARLHAKTAISVANMIKQAQEEEATRLAAAIAALASVSPHKVSTEDEK